MCVLYVLIALVICAIIGYAVYRKADKYKTPEHDIIDIVGKFKGGGGAS